jgi:hypothetical protein
MRDIKGFCKLMDLSIPEYNEFDYYINQFARLEKYKHIKDMIPLYEEAESKYGDVFQLRIERSNQIVKFLEGTRAYKELIDDNLIAENFCSYSPVTNIIVESVPVKVSLLPSAYL